MWNTNFALVGFDPTTSCICCKRLTARPRGPHGREQTTPRLIWYFLKSIFLQWQRSWVRFPRPFGQNFFIFYSFRVECEEMLWKTNKTLKINKKELFRLKWRQIEIKKLKDNLFQTFAHSTSFCWVDCVPHRPP